MYYTTTETAKLLGFTVETVRRKIGRGEIKSTKVRDKHMIPKEEIRRYLFSMVSEKASEEEKNLIVDDILTRNKSK